MLRKHSLSRQQERHSIGDEWKAQLEQSDPSIEHLMFFPHRPSGKENVTIEYCPTKQMIGDFISKPLQGELFNKFKAAVMGHNNSLFEGSADLQGWRLRQECVGRTDQGCVCLLYTSPSPRDLSTSRMPSSA